MGGSRGTHYCHSITQTFLSRRRRHRASTTRVKSRLARRLHLSVKVFVDSKINANQTKRRRNVRKDRSAAKKVKVGRTKPSSLPYAMRRFRSSGKLTLSGGGVSSSCQLLKLAR